VEKKKIMIISTILVVLFLFSGCTTNNVTTDRNDNIFATTPVPIIKAPTKAYFEDTLEFDASDSYDTDGVIEMYTWDFGDGTKTEGKKVKHTYEFLGEYNIRYPLIYTVCLHVKDEGNNKIARLHQIMLYPKKYSFFLTTDKITSIKPMSHKEAIYSTDLSKMGLQPYVTYEFDEAMPILKCTWDATIFLEKPLLSIVTKIVMTFYDKDGNEITQKEQRLGVNNLWKTKEIQIKGNFEKDVEIKMIKISVPNFSLSNKIYILYGDEKPSNIYFDFKDNILS
jgi:hypothetical protein